MGWNGCRLVCLFAVAGGRAVPSGGVRHKLNRFWLSVIRSYHAPVGGLAQALFRRLGFSAPPLPSLLSLLLLGICLSICWWGGSMCFSANPGPSNFSKSRSSPLHVVFSILFHYFLCSLPLPLFLQGWQGCLLTSGVVSVYLLGKVVPKGAWSKSSLTLCSLPCCLSLSLSLSPIDWLHLGGRLGSWREVRQSSLKLNFDITLSRGGWARFPRLWSYFWPSFTCVCRLLLGWKGCPIKSMKQELFDIGFTSVHVFHYLLFISFRWEGWLALEGRSGKALST